MLTASSIKTIDRLASLEASLFWFFLLSLTTHAACKASVVQQRTKTHTFTLLVLTASRYEHDHERINYSTVFSAYSGVRVDSSASTSRAAQAATANAKTTFFEVWFLP